MKINESYLWRKYQKLETKYNHVDINNLDSQAIEIIKRVFWECEGIISALCWITQVSEQMSNVIDDYISLFEELKAKTEKVYYLNQDVFEGFELYERIIGE